ncbi:phage virion morphogenesis protein [Phaeobacter sp. 11ANDIMAR09]|uniref:phage virion morphogenesis protein n=1 Tax=Phaeobacter sp. 11ANDIMAR09 TaxID=1225647 RepID=UPI0006C8B657|nr:phage virion morphogenesis protein [Phaeobacter sp. 11ANDIMAR09]KPD10871.1 phage morphogenesis protein [Phaeobacter sp. 11ANDIMAR09]
MTGLEYNTDTLDPLLIALLEATGDLTEFMQDAGELLVSATQDRVLQGLQPDGAPFAPRSAATLKRYTKLGLSFGAPLNVSGDMRNHLHYAADKDSMEFGSNAIQSAVMQFGAEKGAFGTAANGSSIPWGNIPARPFIGISEDDETNLALELEEWLEHAADSRG